MPVKRTTETRKATTAWKAFRNAGRKLTRIKCRGYKPVHSSNEGCHANILLDPKAILGHIENGHSCLPGTLGVIFTTEPTESPDPFWQAAEDAGLEIHDFRCDVCGKVLPLHNFTIRNCCKPHSGDSRRVQTGGTFRVTLALTPPQPDFDEMGDEE